MRSAHFLWRSCHVQCDSTSEPTSGKQFARTLVRACLGAGGGLTLVRACVGAGRGSWKGSRHRWQLPRGLGLDVIRVVKATVCKDACKGLPWCRPGVVEGVETPLAVAPRVGPRAARSSRGDGALRLVPSGASCTSGRIFGTCR